jgi:hypothetical protein
MSNLSIRNVQLPNMSLYLSNHYWLIADQRFRLGVAIALPCVFMALAWRTIATKDSPQEPPTIAESSTRTQEPQTTTATKPDTKPDTVVPATNTRVTMRAPNPITTANVPTQAPAVPPKTAGAVRAPRYRRTVPEKKAEIVVQALEEERPATPETPTSRPKRKFTTTAAELVTPLVAQGHQHQEQLHHHHQQSFPADRQEPDVLSIGSNGSSTEHQSSSSSNYKNRTVRMGKNLKRAWSKRPFAGIGSGNSPDAAHIRGGESILFPDSPTIPSVNLRV